MVVRGQRQGRRPTPVTVLLRFGRTDALPGPARLLRRRQGRVARLDRDLPGVADLAAARTALDVLTGPGRRLAGSLKVAHTSLPLGAIRLMAARDEQLFVLENGIAGADDDLRPGVDRYPWRPASRLRAANAERTIPCTRT